MKKIPENFQNLFKKKSFASFATVMPDGTPHVTPVWIDHDGEYILINTSEGRQKEKNIRQNKKVGISITDPQDPYRHISIRGEVVETTKEGAVEHIDKLAKRYMGVEEYPNMEEGEIRIILKILPKNVKTLEN